MKLYPRGSSAVLLGLIITACDGPAVTSAGGNPAGRKDGGAADPAGDGGGPVTPDFTFPGRGDGGGAGNADGGGFGSGPMENECAHDVQTAKLTPIDMLLLLDASGSMAEKAGARNRWELAREALAAFFKDNRSVGLSVGLQMFPLHPRTCGDDGDCFLPSPGGCVNYSACLAPNAPLGSGISCGSPADDDCPAGTACVPLGRCSASGGDCVGMGQPCPSGVANDMCGPRMRQCRLGPSSRGTCAVADYQKPIVPIGELPAAGARLTGAMDTRLAVGGTPLSPALKGAVAYLAAHAATNAGRRTVLVIVSDGVPGACGDNATILADLRAAAMATPGLPTYVVGVFSDNDPPEARPLMEQFAVAGGTRAALAVTANEQLAEKFLAALSQIRGAAVPCDLAIPKPSAGQIDFGKVNVRINAGAGPADLAYVERRERCDLAPNGNGWYYDVDPNMATPSRVLLCPAVCERIKADPQGAIELRFGCQSIVIK
jgi:hypothetical protein